MHELPNAPEAEISVLGAMLLDASAIERVVDLLKPEHFFAKRHRTVYAAILGLLADGLAVDPPSLREYLASRGKLDDVGGLPFIADLMDAVPTAANVTGHAQIVLDAAVRRQMIAGAGRIAEMARDPEKRAVDALDTAQTLMLGMTTGAATREFRQARESIMPLFARIEERANKGGGLLGHATGFRDVDEMTGGWQAGDLIVIAARPSMGKTAFVLGTALNMALNGLSVGVASLEMSREQLVARMISHEALVDLQAMLRGRLRDDDYVRMAQAANRLNEAAVYIDERRGINIADLRAASRRIKAENGLDALIVDYIQLMSGEGENRNQEVSAITRGLKTLAGDLNVPVIALSQLSRKVEERADKRPHLADLRESGSIEQDADVVGFLYRPEYYVDVIEAQEKGLTGKAELILSKQRNGPTGTVELFFRKECARFEDMRHLRAA